MTRLTVDLGVQHTVLRAVPCLQTAAGLCAVSAPHHQVKSGDRESGDRESGYRESGYRVDSAGRSGS